MSKYKGLAVVLIAVVVGAAAGLWLAEWRFNDADVLLGARVLLGGGGALLAGFAAKRLFVRTAAVEE